eukprot:1626307-Pyramimonas_sp.AAC.1
MHQGMAPPGSTSKTALPSTRGGIWMRYGKPVRWLPTPVRVLDVDICATLRSEPRACPSRAQLKVMLWTLRLT